MKDSGGPGRWRGGTGGELAIVPHKAPDGGIHYVISGKGARHPMSDGLAGGYPGRAQRLCLGQARRHRRQPAAIRPERRAMANRSPGASSR